MHRLPKIHYHDIERIIEFDFVRATEAAALNSLKWLGRGDKEKADEAACDAMRGMFDLMNICGEVVIGEGIKDDAPGIFKGEQLGTWLPGSPQFDIAIDPIDGTTNISKGAPNSISCIAAASPEEGVKVALRDVPSFYMSKLAYGPRVIQYMQKRGDSLKIDSPIPETLAIVARAVDKRVQDVVVMMLDRPRHKEIVEEIRAAGASLRMIGDGDIAAAMSPSPIMRSDAPAARISSTISLCRGRSSIITTTSCTLLSTARATIAKVSGIGLSILSESPRFCMY